jgi:hypothetical protein
MNIPKVGAKSTASCKESWLSDLIGLLNYASLSYGRIIVNKKLERK